MAVTLAATLKAALVVARGHHGFVGALQNSHIIFIVFGVGNAYLPVFAVRLFSVGKDGSAEVQNSRFHAGFAQNFPGLIGGIALGDSSQIELHTVWNYGSIAVYGNFFVIDVFKQAVELALSRDFIIFVDKAPLFHDRINGDVEVAVGKTAQLDRPFDKLCRFIVKLETAAFI